MNVERKFLNILLVVACMALVLGLAGCKESNPSKTTGVPTTPDATCSAGPTRTITDMFGREVIVPSIINKVLATGPVEMELIYMLAPDKLAGLCFEFNGSPPFAHDKYMALPIIGGWFGTQVGNYESFISIQPDIVIDGYQADINERQSKFGDIPVVGVETGDQLFYYTEAARFLGVLLGVEEKAESFITYYEEAKAYVDKITSSIPENEKTRIYYAEGKEGFHTDPVGSHHTILLEFCGGVNVADVSLLPGYGMAEASMEQILLWNPDLIIIGRGSQSALYQSIMSDKRWAGLQAVQEGRVFLRPDNPFSWFDGPPGPCQILGMYWMISLLYPEQTQDLDLAEKITEFYGDFLHYDLQPAEVEKFLSVPS